MTLPLLPPTIITYRLLPRISSLIVLSWTMIVPTFLAHFLSFSFVIFIYILIYNDKITIVKEIIYVYIKRFLWKNSGEQWIGTVLRCKLSVGLNWVRCVYFIFYLAIISNFIVIAIFTLIVSNCIAYPNSSSTDEMDFKGNKPIAIAFGVSKLELNFSIHTSPRTTLFHSISSIKRRE